MVSFAAIFGLSTLYHYGQRGTLVLDQVKAGPRGLGCGLDQLLGNLDSVCETDGIHCMEFKRIICHSGTSFQVIKHGYSYFPARRCSRVV